MWNKLLIFLGIRKKRILNIAYDKRAMEKYIATSLFNEFAKLEGLPQMKSGIVFKYQKVCKDHDDKYDAINPKFMVKFTKVN